MTEHFDGTGEEFTKRTLELAIQRAKMLGIDEMVVATTSGETALLASYHFDGRVIAVTHAYGTKEPFTGELDEEKCGLLAQKGVKIVTAGHALSGVERAISGKSKGMYPVEIIANTLRMFGQGTKVCVECVVMAADAGHLSGRPVMTIGGTGRGADTAMVILPAHGKDIFDLRICETVCKPSFISTSVGKD